MPRRARLAIAGIPWHIIQRGNNRSACFYTDEDYRRYLETLAEQAEKFGCAVHAYCLMTNHVHLLLTPDEQDSTALMMKHLGQRYVQYINRTYRRTGTLWEGRFRSCLAQSDTYVLRCYQYIELNPVRAGMVSNPADYRWSSYRANSGGSVDLLLTPQLEYLRLGDTAAVRQSFYRHLFDAHLDPSDVRDIRQATNGNYVLGNERFKEEIEAILERRVSRGKAGRPSKVAG
ncbi:MAG: transposase [Thiotrichaceae bacterium]